MFISNCNTHTSTHTHTSVDTYYYYYYIIILYYYIIIIILLNYTHGREGGGLQTVSSHEAPSIICLHYYAFVLETIGCIECFEGHRSIVVIPCFHNACFIYVFWHLFYLSIDTLTRKYIKTWVKVYIVVKQKHPKSIPRPLCRPPPV